MVILNPDDRRARLPKGAVSGKKIENQERREADPQSMSASDLTPQLYRSATSR